MSYKRKTKDVYGIFGNYGKGWEEVCAESTYKDAKIRRKEYRDNDIAGIFRIKVYREKIA